MGSPTHIEKVLLNLLSNAIKYNKPNGKVYLSVKEKADCFEFVVEDTGIGMSEEFIQNKLFKPLFKKYTYRWCRFRYEYCARACKEDGWHNQGGK